MKKNHLFKWESIENEMDFPRLSKIFSPFPEKAGCIIVVKSSQADGCVNVTSIKKRKKTQMENVTSRSEISLKIHLSGYIQRFYLHAYSKIRATGMDLVRTRENVMHA